MIFLALLFVFVFLLTLTGVNMLSLSFFTTFYVWNLVFQLPEMRERAMTHRYRLSFLRQMFRVDDLIATRSPQVHPIIRRQMPVVTLMGIAFWVTFDFGVFFGILGGLLVEGLCVLFRSQNGIFKHFKKFGK